MPGIRGCVAALAMLVAGADPQFIITTLPAPVLVSLSVTSGPVGTTVVLSGRGFGAQQGTGSVVFFLTPATPTAWSDTSITVTVPSGAPLGSDDVHVNTVNGPSNRIAFTVAGGGITCNQTLSVGADIPTAVTNAPNNTTICLNSGNYDVIDFFNITRTGYVTLVSTTGVGAQMSPQVGGSSFIRFQSLTLTNGGVTSCSTNIYFNNNTWQQDQPGLGIDETSCPNTVQNITIDGDIFDRVGQPGSEGRLEIIGANTVTVKNSQFLGESQNSVPPASGPTDGINVGNPVTNLTIGPNNLFSGILQSICNAVNPSNPTHCDSIQVFGACCGPLTVNGNFFTNSSNVCQCTDNDVANLTFTNNVISGDGEMQIGCGVGACNGSSLNGFHLDHNTFYNTPSVQMNSTTGGTFRGNLLLGTSFFNTGGGHAPCVSCTVSFNMCDAASVSAGCDGGGTNDITGSSPTFIPPNVIPPTTFHGWQMAVTSIGHNGAYDGTDIGTNYYGP